MNDLNPRLYAALLRDPARAQELADLIAQLSAARAAQADTLPSPAPPLRVTPD